MHFSQGLHKTICSAACVSAQACTWEAKAIVLYRDLGGFKRRPTADIWWQAQRASGSALSSRSANSTMWCPGISRATWWGRSFQSGAANQGEGVCIRLGPCRQSGSELYSFLSGPARGGAQPESLPQHTSHSTKANAVCQQDSWNFHFSNSWPANRTLTKLRSGTWQDSGLSPLALRLKPGWGRPWDACSAACGPPPAPDGLWGQTECTCIGPLGGTVPVSETPEWLMWIRHYTRSGGEYTHKVVGSKCVRHRFLLNCPFKDIQFSLAWLCILDLYPSNVFLSHRISLIYSTFPPSVVFIFCILVKIPLKKLLEGEAVSK